MSKKRKEKKRTTRAICLISGSSKPQTRPQRRPSHTIPRVNHPYPASFELVRTKQAQCRP